MSELLRQQLELQVATGGGEIHADTESSVERGGLVATEESSGKRARVRVGGGERELKEESSRHWRAYAGHVLRRAALSAACDHESGARMARDYTKMRHMASRDGIGRWRRRPASGMEEERERGNPNPNNLALIPC